MGCQTPTFRLAQQYENTQGAYAVKAMKALGVTLDEWQVPIINDWFAVRDDGIYVHMRCGLVVPRQNGKTLLLETRIVAGAVLKGETILFTAHDYSTVTKLFDRLKIYFGENANDPDAQFPELNQMVRSVRKAIGKEAIFLKNGAVIYLSTRTKTAKRGYTVDVFIGDEAQELTEVQAKAMLSTATSGEKKNPQFIYCGTPPDVECHGDILPAIRKEAHGEAGKDLSYTEWSISEVGDIFDVGAWYRHNPALGIRMTESVLYGLAKTFTDPISFAQECLGYFLPEGRQIEHLVDEDAWQACKTEPLKDGELFFSIKFSPDGKFGALCAALKPESDIESIYVELIAIKPLEIGLMWFAQFLLDAADGVSAIVIDGGGTAEDLFSRLKDGGISKKKIMLAKTHDAVSAYASFTVAVNELAVSHMGQDELNKSVTLTSKRKIGKDGFGFASNEYANAIGADAAAFAYWIAKTTKRKIKDDTEPAVWFI